VVESQWGLSENNRKAKYYQLSAAGRRNLRQKAGEWTAYTNAVFKILATGIGRSDMSNEHRDRRARRVAASSA
jgi:DNA-binding PadR family transcriptional regulator